MNWLEKINISLLIKRFGPYRTMILIMVILTACLYVGYRAGNYFHGHQVQMLKEQKERLDTLYQQNNEQTRQINTLTLELEVEQLANKRSLAAIKEMEVTHYKVKKQLAFYEKVMAPEKQAEGLAIHDLVINATESPEYYRFQVVLIQQNVNKRAGKGKVDLIFVGSLDNTPSTIKLSEISTLTKDDLDFSFRYFQLINGDFTLPKGFIVEQVTVSATLAKDRRQSGKQLDKSFPWLALIDNENIITEKTIKDASQ